MKLLDRRITYYDLVLQAFPAQVAYVTDKRVALHMMHLLQTQGATNPLQTYHLASDELDQVQFMCSHGLRDMSFDCGVPWCVSKITSNNTITQGVAFHGEELYFKYRDELLRCVNDGVRRLYGRALEYYVREQGWL